MSGVDPNLIGSFASYGALGVFSALLVADKIAPTGERDRLRKVADRVANELLPETLRQSQVMHDVARLLIEVQEDLRKSEHDADVRRAVDDDRRGRGDKSA